jgi:histidinol-phosphatase
MNPHWRARYEMGIELTKQAAKKAQSFFDTRLAVEWKADESPVTIADRTTEQFLRERLMAAFPHDGFIGEEFASQPGESGFQWIIDPIDGTRNFLRGIPIWATLVGLMERGELIAGIVCNPNFNHTHHALRGEGAYRDGQRIRVSDRATLAESAFCYTSMTLFLEIGLADRFVKLVQSTNHQRGFGDYYGYVMIAQGSMDVMVDRGVHIWDIAGPKVIVEEAGGMFTTWDGRTDLHATDVLVSNGKVHAQTQRLLAGD